MVSEDTHKLLNIVTGGGKKIISGLDILKFIMAIFIVNIHLKPFIYAPEWMRNMVSIVSALAVPIFFTISSFLFFLNSATHIVRNKFKILSNNILPGILPCQKIHLT